MMRLLTSPTFPSETPSLLGAGEYVYLFTEEKRLPRPAYKKDFIRDCLLRFVRDLSELASESLILASAIQLHST
jgi:hypothetical protein